MRKKLPGKDTWEAPAAVFFFVCCSLGEFNCKLQTKKQQKQQRRGQEIVPFLSFVYAPLPGPGTRHWLVAVKVERGGLETSQASPFFFAFFAAFAFSPSKPPSAVGSPKQVRILPPGERRGPPGPLSCWNCQHLMRVSQHYLCISETC